MRFAVIGTGGVGGYFGARLAAAGLDVVSTARGAHYEALRTSGLRVVSTDGTTVVPPGHFVGSAGAIGPADVVLVCVKTYDAQQVVRELSGVLQPETVIISLQNGVENDALWRGAFPRCHVFGGTAYIYATITRPGEVTERGGPKKIAFGPYPGASPELARRASRILDVVAGAGITAEIPADIVAAIWKKFIFITGAAGITALTRLTLGEILAVPATRTLLTDAMRETEAVAHARGVSIEPAYLESVFETLGKFDTATRSSLYNDLAHGKPLEIEALSGTVVRLGAAAGIPTPVHRTIYATLLPHHLLHMKNRKS
jgi:2-dehydropantoate 2-reductase